MHVKRRILRGIVVSSLKATVHNGQTEPKTFEQDVSFAQLLCTVSTIFLHILIINQKGKTTIFGSFLYIILIKYSHFSF